MTPDELEAGLLAHNFFPRVARRGDEFPPSFNSLGFTRQIASKLISQKTKRGNGYGVIDANATRYDLAPRSMGIVHPTAYAIICRQLYASWEEWSAVLGNESSSIRVAKHSDGRVFSMVAIARSESLLSAGSRFWTKVDITNFYGSIYTHAFPWAVHGIVVAKEKQNDKSDWTNQLDAALRLARRKETTGLPVGPGTSAIAGEILLASIDNALRSQGFHFLRFIDDYFFAAKTREEAESFVAALRGELALLKLVIHPGKTSIKELPLALSPKWQRSLRASLRGANSVSRLLDAIDEAVDDNKAGGEDGVLRYLLNSLETILASQKLPPDSRDAVVERLLHLAYLRPAVVGTACRLLLESGGEAVRERQAQLNNILSEHALALRTDAATWLLHALIKSGVPLSQGAVDSVIKSRDCLMLALLAEDSEWSNEVGNFISKLEAEFPEDYRRDEYWLLYYQFALRGSLWRSVPSAFYDDFRPLLEASVSFIDLNQANPYEPIHLRASLPSKHVSPGVEEASSARGGVGLGPHSGA